MMNSTNMSVTDTTNPVLPPTLGDLEREEALVRRFNRKSHPDLTFEFSNDPGLLHQYYILRASEFNAVLGYTDYPPHETEHDHNGQILIVRLGNLCVGGIRMNVKTPRKPTLLPVEADNFRLEDHFPLLREKSYGQLAELVLLPEFRYGKVLRQIGERILNRVSALDLKMLFATCPLSNARLYRLDAVVLGVHSTQIHQDIVLPKRIHVGGIRRYLMSGLLPDFSSAAAHSASFKTADLQEV